MEDQRNQKEQLTKLIQDLGQQVNPDKGKKIDFKQLESISIRLIQFFDECEECQEYTSLIIQYAEKTNQFKDLVNKQDILDVQRNVKAIISHMQNKHKLITEGYYMTLYMSVGMAIGVALGSAFKNIAIGIPIGLCIGVAIGISVDADCKKRGKVI